MIMSKKIFRAFVMEHDFRLMTDHELETFQGIEGKGMIADEKGYCLIAHDGGYNLITQDPYEFIYDNDYVCQHVMGRDENDNGS